ncbi:MAG: hypothetical protein AAFY71_19680 [Bacteroidota bacterium]
MKAQSLFLYVCMWFPILLYGQEDRLHQLSLQLDSLSEEIPALLEETELSFTRIPLSTYVRAVGREHGINVHIEETPTIRLTSHLQKEQVKNIFLFLCKNYHYTLESTGSILHFLPLTEPEDLQEEDEKELLAIDFKDGLLSVDLKGDSIFSVVRRISELSGRKLLVPTGTSYQLEVYLPPTPIDTAIEAIFETNGFKVKHHRKGYTLISPLASNGLSKPTQAIRSHSFQVEVFTDGENRLINVEAENSPLVEVIQDIFDRLEADFILYDPLEGHISCKAEFSNLDEWLELILKGTPFAYKKSGNMYMLGRANHEWLLHTTAVKLEHRPSYQIMELIPGIEEVTSSESSNTLGSSSRPFPTNTTVGQNGFSSLGQGNSSQPTSYPQSSRIFKAKAGEVEMVDYPELNEIILKGPADQVQETISMIKQLDQPIPMVRIEMLVVEINKDRLLNTKLKAGFRNGNDSSGNRQVLPGLDMNVGGEALDNLLGSIPNLQPLGLLDQGFYLNLQAQESRGNLKVQMKPILSMLNGREGSLTIGQTQYFLLETTTSSAGAVNNFQQFTQRFESIVANVTLWLRPFVSDDGMVTLDVLPDFTTPVGSFDADVPPTIATRRFVSTIRVKNGETMVLGGLTEEAMGENTQGLPWLSRVPVLKWIFGNVQKSKNKSSLLIYITPIVSYN